MFHHHIHRALVCAIACVALLGVAACSSDDSSPVAPAASGAPDMPNMSTLVMNVSFFGLDGASPSASKAAADAMLASAGNKTNWINAVVRVLFVQLTFYDAFEEPIGAFAAAIHSVPQHQLDDSWLWTFIFVEDGIDYGIFLFGKEVEDHIDWRMEVSSTNPEFLLDHFVWFDGQSQLDESAGFWQFYEPVLTPPAAAGFNAAAMTPGVPSVRIDWLNIAPDDHQLSSLVNRVGSPEFGDLLVFHETPGMSTVDYHDEDLLEDHNITWFADGSGSITAPDFNNGLISCWDTKQEDTTCP